MADELDNTIAENAGGPKRASADGISVEQHSIPDQIAADKYLASKRATRGVRKPRLLINRISPPGAV